MLCVSRCVFCHHQAVHDASYVRKMSEKVPTQGGSQVTVHATLSTLEMENSDANVRSSTPHGE